MVAKNDDAVASASTKIGLFLEADWLSSPRHRRQARTPYPEARYIFKQRKETCFFMQFLQRKKKKHNVLNICILIRKYCQQPNIMALFFFLALGMGDLLTVISDSLPQQTHRWWRG